MTGVVLGTLVALAAAVGMVGGLRRRDPARPSAVGAVRWLLQADDRLAADLELAGIPWEQFQREVVLAAAGAGAAGIAAGVLTAGGTTGRLIAATVLAVLGGLLGSAWAIARVRRAARSRRRQAVRVVGSYLDLVVMCLAGGMGVESALDAAASVPDDDLTVLLAMRLQVARHDGRPPWAALAELGETLGVRELVELAGVASLAGTEGARIRTTLSAKAASMRRRQVAEMEAEANAVTERLFLPGALLLVGFLVFLGYPALVRVLSGL